ncbi:MAG: cell wall hydrolase [Lachnospiraceae bacterium]|nr:cell wall hydrolase [Lachnospiraceae bacterium]
MRRRDIINELKLCLIGAGLGAAVFGSFLFFGMKAKACEIRDGVHTPIRAELVTMDRAEREDMRNAATGAVVSEVVEQLSNNSPEVGNNFGDLDLLAALVWAEAGDQDFIGMRIVADCVCNRASDRHPEWPSSISSVIYQPGQFSVVANGRLDQGFYNATPDCYEAARLALSGDLYDPNVIYFSMYTCANGVFAYQHGDHFIGY